MITFPPSLTIEALLKGTEITIGSYAPDFSSEDGDGRIINLADVLTSHHAILYFVREYT